MPRETKSTEERVTEWLAIIGIPVSALGYFLAGFLPTKTLQPDFVLKSLGLALFLGGVFGSTRLLVRQVSRLREDMTLSLAQLKDEHVHVQTYRDILDLALSIDPDDATVPVRAASQTLRNVISDHVASATASVKTFRSSFPNSRIEIREYSPIFDLMFRLAEALPAGSVWLGITHLNNASAWTESADVSFKKYRSLIMRRSTARELTAFRIFCVGPDENDKLRKLTPVMAEESRAGIKVGLLQIAKNKWPPDMSVLYLPPTGKTVSTLSQGRPVETPDDILAHGYRPLCLLNYELSDGLLVHNLHIYPGVSDSFRLAMARFKAEWATAVATGSGAET